jgi:hypothetical protein
MQKLLIIISVAFLSFSGFGQSSKLKGRWVSSKQEYMLINDTLDKSNILCGKDQWENYLNLSIHANTLSFYNSYTSSTDNFKTMRIRSYDYTIIAVTDSALTIRTTSKLSKDLFNGADTIKFIRQEYTVDTSFHFEKLIFHTTVCFGSCPVLDIQIDSNKEILYHALIPKNKSRLSPSDTFNCKGTLRQPEYDQLLRLLKTSNLRNLQYNVQTCCDAPLITLIVYYNGERKYIQSMSLPPVINDLIFFLYHLNEKAVLKNIPGKIVLEE